MKLFVIAAFLATTATPALANWTVDKTEPDVFGEVNVSVTGFGDNSTMIRLECGSKNMAPRIAYLIRSGGSAVDAADADILVVNAEGDRSVGLALLEGWNDTYAAVTSTDLDFLVALTDAMTVATKAIPIGFEVKARNFRESDTFLPRGSTEAAKVFRDNCLSPKE